MDLESGLMMGNAGINLWGFVRVMRIRFEFVVSLFGHSEYTLTDISKKLHIHSPNTIADKKLILMSH